MKTKNKVRNTIIQWLIISGFIFPGLSINAQEFLEPVWADFSSNYHTMALLKTKAKTNTEISKVKSTITPAMLAEFSAIEKENPLDLEDWMIEEDIFVDEIFYLEREKELKLESWMLEESFGKNLKSKSELLMEYCVLEKEPVLVLEPWMIEDDKWK